METGVHIQALIGGVSVIDVSDTGTFPVFDMTTVTTIVPPAWTLEVAVFATFSGTTGVTVMPLVTATVVE
jgi:hypothetical protein